MEYAPEFTLLGIAVTVVKAGSKIRVNPHPV